MRSTRITLLTSVNKNGLIWNLWQHFGQIHVWYTSEKCIWKRHCTCCWRKMIWQLCVALISTIASLFFEVCSHYHVSTSFRCNQGLLNFNNSNRVPWISKRWWIKSHHLHNDTNFMIYDSWNVELLIMSRKVLSSNIPKCNIVNKDEYFSWALFSLPVGTEYLKIFELPAQIETTSTSIRSLSSLKRHDYIIVNNFQPSET